LLDAALGVKDPSSTRQPAMLGEDGMLFEAGDKNRGYRAVEGAGHVRRAP